MAAIRTTLANSDMRLLPNFLTRIIGFVSNMLHVICSLRAGVRDCTSLVTGAMWVSIHHRFERGQNQRSVCLVDGKSGMTLISLILSERVVIYEVNTSFRALFKFYRRLFKNAQTLHSNLKNFSLCEVMKQFMIATEKLTWIVTSTVLRYCLNFGQASSTIINVNFRYHCRWWHVLSTISSRNHIDTSLLLPPTSGGSRGMGGCIPPLAWRQKYRGTILAPTPK